jgi:AraC-like DNA-binding protein
MRKFVFSSDDLPATVSEQARYKLWLDRYVATFGECTMRTAESVPFTMRSEFALFGDVAVLQASGTIIAAARNKQQVATDKNDDFMLAFNCGATLAQVSQRGRELVAGPGHAMLWTMGEAMKTRMSGVGLASNGLNIPANRLRALVADVDDLVCKPIDADTPAMRHLERYLDFLMNSDELDDQPEMAERIGSVLVDLVALALGAGRDAGALAPMRGLRAARVQEILATIKVGFSDPMFSAVTVGLKLGLSARYVQELLQETGASFTARVLELRLQKGRAMLESFANDHLKVSDIAFACGFNEVSYFNRCFRRRFGASPTQYRGGHGNGHDRPE